MLLVLLFTALLCCVLLVKTVFFAEDESMMTRTDVQSCYLTLLLTRMRTPTIVCGGAESVKRNQDKNEFSGKKEIKRNIPDNYYNINGKKKIAGSPTEVDLHVRSLPIDTLFPTA